MGTPQSVARIYFCRLDKYPPVLAAGSWVGGRCCERRGNCLIRFTAWRSGCGHVMRIVHVQNWSRESLMNDWRVYGRIWIYRNERLDVGVWPAFWERVDAAVEIALLDSLKRCGHVIRIVHVQNWSRGLLMNDPVSTDEFGHMETRLKHLD